MYPILRYWLSAAARKGANQKLAKKVVKAFNSNKPITFSKGERKEIFRVARLVNKKAQVPGYPHIGIRRELYPNPYTGQAGSIYFGGNKRVPMMDVDFPATAGQKASHMAMQMPHDFKGKSDYMKHLEKFLKKTGNEDKAFRVYDTNAGLRLFDVSKRQSPLMYNIGGTPTALKTDPMYAAKSVLDMNLNPRFGPLRMNFKNRFDYRLSPKPGRNEPFVARFDDTYGSGTPLSKSVDEITMFHDDLISQIMTKKGKDIELGGLFDLVL